MPSGPNLKSVQGFTLIELLLSIIILSAGIVVIDQILLASVSALSYVDNRTEANHVIANKIWDTQEQALRVKKRFPKTGSGIVTANDKKFDFEFGRTGAAMTERLFPLRMKVRWTQTGRSKNLSRDYFIWIPHEKKI